MDKKARDNRANQLNPNNPAYHKSRTGGAKKHSGGSKKSRNKTTIVHHHHHGGNNAGFRCKCCGKAGKLTSIYGSSYMRCGFCGGSFWA